MRRNRNSPSSRDAGNLSRRDPVARVRPPVAKTRGQDARRDAGLPHRQQHVIACPPRPRARGGRRDPSAVSTSVNRRASIAILITSAPVERIARARSTRSDGGSPNACIESTMPRPRRRRVIAGTKSARASTSMNSAPPASAAERIRSRSSSEPANPPPSQAARQVTITGRRRPSIAPSGVRTVHAVQAQLDHVGVRRRVARAAQLFHRSSGDGDAQLRGSCGHKNKKPPQPGLRRLAGILFPAACRLTDRPPSARVPPPIGPKGPRAQAIRLGEKRQRQNECDNNRLAGSLSICTLAPAQRATRAGIVDPAGLASRPFSLTGKQLASKLI